MNEKKPIKQKMKLKTSISFDAAHRLVGYEGKCNNLHGHIWNVEIEIEGEKLNDVGILWDFSNAKKLKELFDHKTILKDCDENEELIKAIENCRWGTIRSVYLMGNNPTAENLAELILSYLKQDDRFLKFKVKVWESPKSYAEVEG